MSGNTSALRLARASSLLLAACLPFGPAAAQWAGDAPRAVIVVDMDRALRESAASSALRERESVERRALRARLDALQAALEAEEAELVTLRDTLDKAAFEARVKDFDQRVRVARRTAQEDAAALQARFAAAEARLRDVIAPLLDALREQSGASVALDRRTVLSARAELDATDALIARLNAAQPGADGILASQ